MLGRILLVYKQHRFEVLTVVAVSLFVAIGSLIEGLRFNAIHLPDGCAPYTAEQVQQGFWGGSPPSAACIAASSQWLGVKHSIEMNLIPTAPWMLPLLFGILLGAPLVAREIENGTAPLSWALAGSRRTWLAWRMAAMIVLMVPLLVVLGFTSDFFDANANQGLNAWASFTDYAGRGAILVFWGLAAFGGTVALSALLGRTVPALVVAAIVCLIVRGAWEAGANRTFLAPFQGMLVTQAEAQSGQFEWPSYQTDLVTTSQSWLDGKPWNGDLSKWWMDHQVPAVPMPTPDASGHVPDFVPAPALQGPYSVPFGFHGEMYWPVIAYESAVLLAGAILCAGIGLFWVGRRRPY